MTSIVVLLYFKQENCEILISLYNWGWMKLCQSQLVSYKVQWFCSLAGFHGGLLSFYFAPLLRLFKCSFLLYFSFFFFWCSSLFWRAEKRLWCWGPGGAGCIITANYSCVCADCLPAAAVENQQTLLPLLSLTAEQYTICICCYFATIFILFLIFLPPKKTWVVSVLSSRAQTARLAGW